MSNFLPLFKALLANNENNDFTSIAPVVLAPLFHLLQQFTDADSAAFQELKNIISETDDEISKCIDAHVTLIALQKSIENVKHENLKIGLSVDQLNAIVSQVTRGKIKTIIAEPAPAVLLAAAYFEKSWKTKFSPDKTKARAFQQLNGEYINVSLMNISFKNSNKIPFFVNDKIEAVLLPYAGEDSFAFVGLPFHAGEKGMQESLEFLLESFDQVVQEDMQLGTGHVALPRFALDTGIVSIKDEMASAMGLTECMSATAFSKLDKNMYVESVVQRVVIEVDEQGTVAAAAAAIRMKRKRDTTDFSISCERSFFFGVLDENKKLLFFALINTPTIAEEKKE